MAYTLYQINHKDRQMSPTDKKSASKKPTVKKSASKKTAAKKTAVKKSAAKKTTVKKSASRKTAAKKTAVKKAVVKKTVTKKPSLDHNEVSKVSARNLETIAKDIDRQMKMLAEIDTRMVIAKDQLADFQEKVQAKISAFKERNANKPEGAHKDLMTSIRETRDEASKIIKDSKAIHDTYESAVKYFEKGRVAALKEAKKAEVVLVKNLHKIEAKVLKKASEINKNIKNSKREK
jgi:hypothetical protein